MKSFIRAGLAAGLVAASLFASVQSAVAAPSAPEAVWSVDVQATTTGITVTVVDDDYDYSGTPWVYYTLDSETWSEIPWVSDEYLGGWYFTNTYRASVSWPCGAKGVIAVIDYPIDERAQNVSPAWVDFPGVPLAFVDFEVQCSQLGSIRGTAYKDGAVFGGAWYKITDGGNWFVCGTVGGDGTFGVPVAAGTYYLVPLDLPGLKASGITKVVVTAGKAELSNDIKYVTDATAKHESCDLYNPAKPIPTSVR